MNPNAQPGAPESGPAQAPSGSLHAYDQPVAYDNNGQPLYAHPPTDQQVMYLSRPYQPPKQEISPEVQARAAESRKKYPQLNLSEGEYVITAINRHPIGLIQIWTVVVVLLALLGAAAAFLLAHADSISFLSSIGGSDALRIGSAMVISLFTVLFFVGGAVASYVYKDNTFYLTNESVIQEMRISLFAKHEQTASLGSIEDASYTQSGIIPTMFNFGTIRLSTPGDESTYTFNYVGNPKQHIATLNNAVEAFKNGRPVAG